MTGLANDVTGTTSDARGRRLRGSKEPLGPGSYLWTYGIDWRGVFMSRSGIWLEVAHPVIGAGMVQHSRFDIDRWRTLTRRLKTMNSVNGVHGPGAAEAASDHLRKVHSNIKGIDSQGRSYHALNADAYLWVPATGYAGQAHVRQVFGGVFDDEIEDGIYEDWKRVFRLLGVPERVIPATRAEFWEYYENMISTGLERNLGIDRVLDVDSRPLPVPPGAKYLPVPAWNLFARPFQAMIRLSGAGLLDPRTRDLLGIEWSPRRQRRFDRLVRIARLVHRVLPERIAYPLRNHVPDSAAPEFFGDWREARDGVTVVH